MTGRTILLAVLLALTGAAQASIIEETTGITYQNDGGSGMDASDVCTDATPGITRLKATEGQLVPIDDEIDAWTLDLGLAPGQVGAIVFEAHPEDLVGSLLGTALRVQVWGPGCGMLLADEVVEDGAVVIEFVSQGPAPHVAQVELVNTTTETPLGAGLGDLPKTEHCAPICVSDYGISTVT